MCLGLLASVLTGGTGCLNSIGEGVSQAAKRRKWAAREEEKMRMERMTQWVSRVRGRNIARRGQFLLT